MGNRIDIITVCVPEMYEYFLTHIRRMDFPIIIIWASPLSFLGALDVTLNYLIFYGFSLSKQNSPSWDAAFCGVTSGAILFAYVQQKGRQAYMS